MGAAGEVKFENVLGLFLVTIRDAALEELDKIRWERCIVDFDVLVPTEAARKRARLTQEQDCTRQRLHESVQDQRVYARSVFRMWKTCS